MGPLILGAGAAVLAVAGLAISYAVGRDAGSTACEAARARDDRVARAASDAAASAAAAAIAAQRPRYVTIRQEAEREIQTQVVYRDCRHGPEQLQRLNAALAGGELPAGGGSVPAASAAAR